MSRFILLCFVFILPLIFPTHAQESAMFLPSGLEPITADNIVDLQIIATLPAPEADNMTIVDLDFSPVIPDVSEEMLVVTNSDLSVTACDDADATSTVTFYDLESGEAAASYEVVCGATITDFNLNGDFAVGALDQLQIHFADGSIKPMEGDWGFVNDLIFDDFLAVYTNRDQHYHLWTIYPGEEYEIVPMQGAFWGRDLGFIGDKIVYTDSNFVRRRNLYLQLEDGRLDHPNAVMGIAYHAESEVLAVVHYNLADEESGQITLWRVGYQGESEQLLTFESLVYRDYLTFSPDGSLLAASAPNGDLAGPDTIIYDVSNGEVVAELPTPLPIAFNADGTLLVGYNFQNEVLLWGVPGEGG